MDKPKEKRMIGIRTTKYSPGNSGSNAIIFDCKNKQTVKELKEFGTTREWCQSEYPYAYILRVNTLYDYDKVLEYIKFLGKEKPEKKKKLIKIRWVWLDDPDNLDLDTRRRAIGFNCADPKTVEQLRSFGKVYRWSGSHPDWSYLVVSPLYAYNEVLQYMEEYPDKEKPKQGSWPFPQKEKLKGWTQVKIPSLCYSCKHSSCSWRGQEKMNLSHKEFRGCPFYQTRDD